MSTKIYQAWRAPAHLVNPAIDWARKRMMAAAKKHIEMLMDNVGASKLGPVPDHIKGDPEGERVWERAKRLDVVWEAVVEDSKSPYRSVLNVTCGLNLWFYGEHVYIMPIGENFITRDMDKRRPRWLEDFCYWNNTDEPDGVTYAEWQRRGATWDKVCCGKGKSSHNARRLYHEVIDATTSMGGFELKMACGEGAMWKWAEKKRAEHQVVADFERARGKK